MKEMTVIVEIRLVWDDNATFENFVDPEEEAKKLLFRKLDNMYLERGVDCRKSKEFTPVGPAFAAC